MWIEQIEMEPNGWELLNPSVTTGIAPRYFYCSGIYGTNMREVVGHRKRDGKMVQYSRDSRRKYELIKGRRIQMNFYNGKIKMRREINSKMLKKGQQKLNTRLCNGVIMRERMEYKCHYHVQKPWAFCKG